MIEILYELPSEVLDLAILDDYVLAYCEDSNFYLVDENGDVRFVFSSNRIH